MLHLRRTVFFHHGWVLTVHVVHIEHHLIIISSGCDRLVLILDELVVSLEFLSERVLDDASHPFELALEVLQLFVASSDRLLK